MVSEGNGVDVGSEYDIGAGIIADDGLAHGEGVEEERVVAELVAQVEYVEGNVCVLEALEEVEVLC